MISELEDYTDGYTAESTITLSSDVMASKNAGTCWGLELVVTLQVSDRGSRGVVCHAIENTASIRTVIAGGHTLYWYTTTVWKNGNLENETYPGKTVGT